MSEENLEIVRDIYSQPLTLDPDLLTGLAEVATPDTVFDFTDAYPDGPVVRGVDGVRRIATTWPWDALHFDPERFLDVDGQRVLVFVRATATGMGAACQSNAALPTSARSATGRSWASRCTPTEDAPSRRPDCRIARRPCFRELSSSSDLAWARSPTPSSLRRGRCARRRRRAARSLRRAARP
jgi:hypothetical protein